VIACAVPGPPLLAGCFKVLRSTARITLLLTFAIAGVIVAGDWRAWFELPSHEIGDLAANALQIERCRHGVEIYGNYSRFNFNHPGPGIFYVYALGQIVLYDWLGLVPSPHNAHRVAGVCFQAFFFALALAIFGRHVRARLFVPLALLLGAVHFGLGKYAFTSVWAPHAALMPFLGFFVACCSVASGHGSHLPLAMLAGGFLVHDHVAQPLFVVTLLVVGYHALWLSTRKASPPATPWRAFGRAHVATGAILALFLLPMVIDWLYWPDCNLRRILQHLQYSGGDCKSVTQSVLYFASFFGYHHDQPEILNGTARSALGRLLEDWGWYVGWTAVFAIAVWRFRCFRRSAASSQAMPELRFVRTTVVLWLLTTLLCVQWGVMQAGPMFEFNGHFYFAVLFVPLLVLAAGVARAWTARGAWIAAVSLSLASVVVVVEAVAPLGSLDSGGLQTLAATNSLLAADPRRESPKVLVFSSAVWTNVAGAMVALVRQGHSFQVEPHFGFAFGRHRRLPSQVPKCTLGGTSVWRFLEKAPDSVGMLFVENLRVTFEPGRIDPASSTIDLSAAGDFELFHVSGFDADQDCQVTIAHEAVFQVASAPSPRDVELVFSAQPLMKPPQVTVQPMELWVNGDAVGRVQLEQGGYQDVALRIPMAVWNRQSVVDFVMKLPGAWSPLELGENGDFRQFGWMVRKLTFRYAD
jgi:hypothetical protein